jgi:hypothetical protein
VCSVSDRTWRECKDGRDLVAIRSSHFSSLLCKVTRATISAKAPPQNMSDPLKSTFLLSSLIINSHLQSSKRYLSFIMSYHPSLGCSSDCLQASRYLVRHSSGVDIALKADLLPTCPHTASHSEKWTIDRLSLYFRLFRYLLVRQSTCKITWMRHLCRLPGSKPGHPHPTRAGCCTPQSVRRL